MLELVNEGGADGGSGWVDVPLTNTSPFDIDCQYRFRVSGLAGNSVIPGFSQTHWYDGTYKAADAIASAGWYYFRSNNKEVLYGINTSNNDVWNATQLLGAKVTKIEKRCGGGGFTTGAGWENVPLTDTADYDTSCLYEVQLKTTDATNNNLMNGDTSWRTVTIRGNKHLGLWFTDGSGYSVWGIQSANKNVYGYRNGSGTFVPVNTVSVLGMRRSCGGGATGGAFGTAWVNFDGTQSTIAMKGASGIASVTKVSAGNYQINFSTPKANTDYGVICTSGPSPAYLCFPHSKTTTGFLLKTSNPTNNVDAAYISVVIN